MNIKAVVFDVGQTLIEYNKPLNWQLLYEPALKEVSETCHLYLTDEKIQNAIEILKKYNTRIHPRDHEVNSSIIFEEIIRYWKENAVDMNLIKEKFFHFFRREANPFPEAEEMLKYLKYKNIKVGALTDVAYGMDNQYALEDIASLSDHIDIAMTSIDVGYRKPNPLGLQMMAKKFHLSVDSIIYVGDEEKDIRCAQNAKTWSAFINRKHEKVNYGQNVTLTKLSDLIKYIEF